MKRVYVLTIMLVLVICSCKKSEEQRITRLVSEWQGREVLLPAHSTFTQYGKDTVDFVANNGKFRIVSYIDSLGCISCKLKLPEWKEFMKETDSLSQGSVSYAFYFNPKNLKELQYSFKRDRFTHPVCIDKEDTFNKLNHFPGDLMFQTFLLDASNKVIAIGNPVNNGKVKQLYQDIITGKKSDSNSSAKTTVTIDKTTADLGTFPWKESQTAVFTLTNTGKSPLAIYQIDTSCGCIKVEYSKKPVMPGKSVEIKAVFTAKAPGYTSKTMTLYSNAEESLIRLKLMGTANN